MNRTKMTGTLKSGKTTECVQIRAPQTTLMKAFTSPRTRTRAMSLRRTKKCERSRFAIAGCVLDSVSVGAPGELTLRYTLVHIDIARSTRHAGHVDLLVKAIDGRGGT